MRVVTIIKSLTILALLCAAPTARATVIVKLELPDLVKRAGTVFVGKAVKKHMHWTADRKHIVTDTTFQVGQSLRGTTGAGGQVTIRALGGVVDGIGMRVAGSPMFSKGDEVLLFTEKRGRHTYVVGMTQGAYRVRRDARGRATVRVNLAGVSLARRTSSGLKLTHGHQEKGPLQHDLKVFITKIKQEMATQRARSAGKKAGAR